MEERSLYIPIKKGAAASGWYLYRIHDDGTGKKPFDIIGADPTGRAVGVEAKVSRRRELPTSIYWADFKPHQISWLRCYAGIGALALAPIFHEKSNTLYLFRILRLCESKPFSGIIEVKDDAWWREELIAVLSLSGGAFQGWPLRVE